MVTNKKYCQVHHFKYNGNECPFCLQERLAGVIKRVNTDNSSYKGDDKVRKEQDKNNSKTLKSMKSDDIRDLLSSKFNVGKL